MFRARKFDYIDFVNLLLLTGSRMPLAFQVAPNGLKVIFLHALMGIGTLPLKPSIG